MKRLLHAVMLLSLVASIDMLANSSEFRSPRRVIRGVMHYPLAPVEDAWWYETMPDTGECEKTWQLETWGAAWRMLATEAFDPCADGSTSHTTSLSSLWFGKDTFRGEEIFAGGRIDDATLLTPTNPFLGFARIAPRFDYNERGVVMGLYFRQSFGEDDCWHVGFRASLPVLEIEIEQDSGCFLEETLDDVVQRLPINLDADVDPNQVDYAYRLDFLSSLSSPASATVGGPIVNVPLVRFGDGTVPTTIGGVQVAGLTAEGTNPDTLNALPAAYVTRANGTTLAASIAAQCGDCDDVDCFSSSCERNCQLNNDENLVTGQFPSLPFRKRASEVEGQLAADGSGGADGDTLFFQLEGVDYSANLALNRQAQGELFVVPRRLEAMDTLVTQAVTIDQRVQAILEFLNPSETAVEFFGAHGIDLCAHDSVVGVGDFYTEFSIGYGNYCDWYGDFLLAVLWPTGTPEGNANRVFHKPTGNNRHFEIKLGVEGGWLVCDWFGFRLDAMYSHAFKRKECRAIPFDQRSVITPAITNNCDCPCEQLFVKNIGQGFEVDISWDYFVGHFDFTFFHPYNPELGGVIGYELMAKSHDHVSLDNNCNNNNNNNNCNNNCDNNCDGRTTITATDLLGRTDQPVNLCILEQNTNAMTHKIYGDLFHRWNYFEIFGGASQIVGGKHAMKETEVHLGMKIFF